MNKLYIHNKTVCKNFLVSTHNKSFSFEFLINHNLKYVCHYSFDLIVLFVVILSLSAHCPCSLFFTVVFHHMKSILILKRICDVINK